MLRKLLKYDLKWIYKLIVIYYGLALVFAVIGRGLSLIDNSLVFDVISKISCGTSVAMMFNILINNIIRIWVRYINNVYKDESYLTHTLPVTKSEIYLSKVLSGLITMATSIVVVLVSFVICYWSDSLVDFIKMIYPGLSWSVIVLTGIVVILELLFLKTSIAFSISFCIPTEILSPQITMPSQTSSRSRPIFRAMLRSSSISSSRKFGKTVCGATVRQSNSASATLL